MKSLAAGGPAQAAGVRPGWAVDWPKTMHLNTRTKLPPTEEFMADPKAVLDTSGLKVAFRNLYPAPRRA